MFIYPDVRMAKDVLCSDMVIANRHQAQRRKLSYKIYQVNQEFYAKHRDGWRVMFCAPDSILCGTRCSVNNSYLDDKKNRF